VNLPRPDDLVTTTERTFFEKDGRFSGHAVLAIDVAFLVAMAVFVLLSPCGDWENQAFGVTLWHNADPGGPYVISSVHFFDPPYPPFLGHPGTTLQFLLHLAARAAHGALALGGVTTPFVAFWAGHIAWLFALSSFVAAALHVTSFHALHAYSRRLGMRQNTASIAVLAYATSFPVLYFGTRVSPEPLLVTLSLVALLQADSCGAALASDRRLRACLLGGGAGAAAVLALFTKMHLAFPLVPLIVLQVLTQARHDALPMAHRLRQGLLPGAAALACAVGVFLVCSLKVPWETFFAFWLPYGPAVPVDPRSGLSLPHGAGLWEMAVGIARVCGRNLAGHFQATANGLFTLSEAFFVALGSLGLIRLWRSSPRASSRLCWAAALCACLFPVAAIRGSWHYYFLYLAFLAIGLAVMIDAFLARTGGASGKRAGGSFRPIVATLLVHGASLTLFIATKVSDVSAYRHGVRPYLSALDNLAPGSRAAIVSKGFKFWLLDGGYPNYIDRDRLELTRTFESRGFIAKRPERITLDLVESLNISCVIDARSGTVRRIPIEEWLAVGGRVTP
jgi:hypothetical protein